MKGLIVKGKGKLRLVTDLDRPVPKEGEVLVKVVAASVNSYDVESAAGNYDAYFKEYGVDEAVRTGLEFAGIVASDSVKFKEGDAVYGYVHLITGCKAHAEYISLPEAYLARKPERLSFEQAASLPTGVLTSLEVYETLAAGSSGKSTLIIGAGGGVGTSAVQIAGILGFEVTTLSSATQMKGLKNLGVEHVLNYKDVALSSLKDKFDIVLDLSTRYTLEDCRPLLTSGGKFIPALPDESNGGTGETDDVGYLMLMEGNGEKLIRVNKWIEDGKLETTLDQIYAFEAHHNAIERLAVRGKLGKIVMSWKIAV
ncbi:MAG: NAD(P)-dependent alcohol dehydrogenase [Opitutaceae bacterium]|nr:NAD(P)-dependent alcohol dehydrogenase [Opitutaceae bacterium]